MGAKDSLLSTITYIFQGNLEDPKEAAKIIAAAVSQSTGEEMMTLVERLHRKVFEEGLV